MKKTVCIFISFLFVLALNAQDISINRLFRDIELNSDTNTYTLQKNTVVFNGDECLYFQYLRDDETCEIKLYPNTNSNITAISLFGSSDYQLVDSLVLLNNEYYRFKIRFLNLSKSRFPALIFLVQTTGIAQKEAIELKLFPYANIATKLISTEDELYIGEEKVFELATTNVSNIRTNGAWSQGEEIDYRLVERNGQLLLYVVPNISGKATLRAKIKTINPILDERKQPTYELPDVVKQFKVKTGRVAYLNLSQADVTLDEKSGREGIEVQIDNNRQLSIQKTYRIEDQEEPGGVLIGELFTRSSLANDKVLCWLKLYNYHRNAQGYLYIKDGDKSLFITNFNVTPKTTVSKISVMHEGGDWSGNLGIYPGETIDVKIEGEGLHKAKFHFEDLVDITSDSSIRNENVVYFKLKVPRNISKRNVGLYNHSTNTGYSLSVREFQTPCLFNYINLGYGDKSRNIETVRGPLIYSKTIRDITLNFDDNLIDRNNVFCGKQYFDVSVRITNLSGELVDLKEIKDIVVCPGESSERAAYYDRKNCAGNEISLNNYLSRKTFDLDEWAKIELEFRNQRDKYNGEGYTRKVELILQKPYRFDIEVSFPAGLLIRKLNTSEKVNMGNVNMAVIAQFSFFDSNRIGKYKPYKIGAGFLALNAFNFSSSDDVNRDMSFVILGSLYPTRKDVKLTFPLYVGFGYLFNANTLFYLVGPGIQVSL